MTVDGIDISHHQRTTPSLAGLEFVFCRATYGTSPDRLYGQHVANVRRAGILVGAYHFGRNQSAADQVTAFLRAAGDVDFYVLDLERDGANPTMTQAQARAFIAGVQARGHRCGLYHSDSGFPDLGQDFDWVANWSRTPRRPWDFWQYRGSPLDLNRFDGTLEELRALAGRPATTPRPTPTPNPAPRPVSAADIDGRRNVAIRYAQVRATNNEMALAARQALYDKPGGRIVTRMSASRRVPHLGLAGRVSGRAWRAVVVGTRWSYSDGRRHRTVLYVPASAGKVVKP